MSNVSERRWVQGIVALFVLLGVTYGLVTPVFEASDELWHYPMIRHLADGNPLPVQVFDPAQAGPWKQEASQPPLYYYLGAALTFWIDTGDMEMVRWENPHVDNGVITADGNNNLVIHNPAWPPWRGTLLAVRMVRLFSVLLGAATVYLTYLIAREVAPQRREIVLGATAVTAFLPMFLFISGAVNNDNLIIPLAALTLLLLIRVVGKRYSVNSNRYSVDQSQRVSPITDDRLPVTDHWQSWLLIGVVIGLAALTKITGVGLLALAWGTAVVAAWQTSDRQITVGRLIDIVLRGTGRWLLVLLPVLLIAGWWYWRNVILYDDWRGWTAFIAVLGERATPASLRQLWAERWGFMLSYWGLFGGVNVPMATWIYHLLNGVLIVSVGGFLIFVVQEVRSWQLQIRRTLQSVINTIFALVVRYFPLVICLLWAGAVVYGLIDWATTTWSSQGRLVFSALPALSILMVVGLVGWLPQRLARRVVVSVSGFMFVVAALAPFVWIAPTYQPGQYTAPWLIPQAVNVNFGNKLRLASFEIGKTAAAPNERTFRPGDTVDVMLRWDVLAPMAEDWSVFVHLNDPVLGVPVAQRDMFLDQGLRPTSLLRQDETIFNYYQIRIPETAVAPADLTLTVGLYNFATGARLPVADGGDAVNLAILELEPLPGEFPNATAVNFEDELELVGFEVNPRRVAAGETIDVTLYWRAQRPLDTDYTFFAQVVGPDTTRYAAQDLPAPTSQWPVGEAQPVPLTLTLAADTPPETYPLIVGAYTATEETPFDRLQIITPDGRPTDDFLRLTPVRVGQ